MEEVVGSIPTGSTNTPSQNVPGNPRARINIGFLRDFRFVSSRGRLGSAEHLVRRQATAEPCAGLYARTSGTFPGVPQAEPFSVIATVEAIAPATTQ
jgi:hypothetical protein